MANNITITVNGNGRIGFIGEGVDFVSVQDFFDQITDANCANYAGDEIADELYEVNDLVDYYEFTFDVDYGNDKINEKVEEYLDGLDYEYIDDTIEQINDFIDEQEEDLIEALLNEGWDFGQVMDDIDDVYYYSNMNGEEIARDYVENCYWDFSKQRFICGYLIDYLDYKEIWNDMRLNGYWVETNLGWVEICC